VGDLLSAASLLFAVVGVLYGLWYPEITEAQAIDIPEHGPNRVKPRRQVTSVLLGRALPLALASTLVALIFLPDVIVIAVGSIRRLQADGADAVRAYDAVQTSFCVVVLFTSAIALHSVARVWRLWKLRNALSEPT
jgi:hypothetical protein